MKIDFKFINEISENYGGVISFNFDSKPKSTIVPNNFTHLYLRKHFIIDKNILRFYHLPTRNILSDEEYEKVKGFIAGERETLLNPYSILIFGAYYSRADLVAKLRSHFYSKNKKVIDGNEIVNFEDLQPYFKDYAKGFEHGFNFFDKEQIEPFLLRFPNNDDYIKKVFEFLTKHIFLVHTWGGGEDGFMLQCNITNNIEEIVGGFEDGKKQGYFYKAWSIVFLNNESFAPLFNELMNSNIESTKKEKLFSVSEWATIFYYAHFSNLLPTQILKRNMEYFIEKHNVNTTYKSFKTRYAEMNKKINKDSNYSIKKFDKIKPFIEKNYKQAVPTLEKDIFYCKGSY